MKPWTIFCGIFHLSAVIQAGLIIQDTGVKSATAGENVTLRCFCRSQVAMHFSWYRQTLGRKPELLSVFYKYDDVSKVFRQLETNPRFSVEIKEGVNHLHISDVRLSDSASYYCGSSHSNSVEFADGVFLSVKGANRQEILQEPPSETTWPGGSLTFKCTIHNRSCDGEQVVYWFKDGHHQGLLHTQRDPCEPVSARESSSQSCVYHLQKENLSSSDAGTYYCAVASCEEILFGRGSRLLIRHDAADQAAQMRTLLRLSVIRTGVLLVLIIVCIFICAHKKF